MKHSEVEIPGEKPIGELENVNGYSVAAAATVAMARNGSAKGDTANGGAKKLVLFGNASRVLDLEDLLRAAQPTGYLAQESLSFLQKRAHCSNHPIPITPPYASRKIIQEKTLSFSEKRNEI